MPVRERRASGIRVIADAASTHPAVIKGGEETASVRYLRPPKVPPRCNRALPRPPARAEALGYRDDLRPVRGFVASKAECAGLTPARIPDLVLATSELAANTLRHTGGGGTVQVWRTREEIICQVADTGQIADPLARYRAPSAELLGVGGHGLWLVNQVCDLVQARTGPAGTTTRLHMRLHRALGRRASRVFKPDEQALRIERLPVARSAGSLSAGDICNRLLGCQNQSSHVQLEPLILWLPAVCCRAGSCFQARGGRGVMYAPSSRLASGAPYGAVSRSFAGARAPGPQPFQEVSPAGCPRRACL